MGRSGRERGKKGGEARRRGAGREEEGGWNREGETQRGTRNEG